MSDRATAWSEFYATYGELFTGVTFFLIAIQSYYVRRTLRLLHNRILLLEGKRADAE